MLLYDNPLPSFSSHIGAPKPLLNRHSSAAVGHTEWWWWYKALVSSSQSDFKIQFRLFSLQIPNVAFRSYRVIHRRFRVQKFLMYFAF